MRRCFATSILIMTLSVGLSEPPPTYRVAVMFNNFLPSGELDTYGLQYKAAIMMAIDQINNKNDGYFDDLLPNTTIEILTVQPKTSKTSGAVSSLYAIDNGVRSCIGPQDRSPIEGIRLLIADNFPSKRTSCRWGQDINGAWHLTDWI